MAYKIKTRVMKSIDNVEEVVYRFDSKQARDRSFNETSVLLTRHNRMLSKEFFSNIREDDMCIQYEVPSQNTICTHQKIEEEELDTDRPVAKGW